MYICTRDDRLRSLNSNTFSAPSQPAYNGWFSSRSYYFLNCIPVASWTQTVCVAYWETVTRPLSFPKHYRLRVWHYLNKWFIVHFIDLPVPYPFLEPGCQVYPRLCSFFLLLNFDTRPNFPSPMWMGNWRVPCGIFRFRAGICHVPAFSSSRV
jgi:hypothetical protein